MSAELTDTEYVEKLRRAASTLSQSNEGNPAFTETGTVLIALHDQNQVKFFTALQRYAGPHADLVHNYFDFVGQESRMNHSPLSHE